MIKLFQEVKEFVDELNSTNSANEKLEILKKRDSAVIRKVLQYTHDYNKVYGVTSKTVKKFEMERKLTDGEYSSTYVDFYSLLDALDNREISGHQALGTIATYIDIYKDYKDIIYSIIDRDLKTRCGIKQYNKVYNCIPVFEVALADKLTDKIAAKTDFKDHYIAQKIDGLRFLVMNVNDTWKAFSRKGKEFKTVSKILDVFEKDYTDLKDYVFDGELCLLNENGEEDFIGISKEYNKKNHTIENPMMLMFDCIPKSEFDAGVGTTCFKDRLNKLQTEITDNQYMRVIEQLEYTEENFAMMQERVEKEGWEGLMLRDGNSVHKGRRTKDLLKVKKFHDDEFQVISVSTGPFRIINDKKLEETIQTMTNVTIKLPSGDKVDVGSGFSLAERKEFFADDSKILGKMITVQYFEKTKTDGRDSLRFPTFKVLHGKKREV